VAIGQQDLANAFNSWPDGDNRANSDFMRGFSIVARQAPTSYDERDRERAAERATRFLTFIYPALKLLPPTQRSAELRRAREMTAKTPALVWLTVAGLALFMGLFAVRQLLGLRNASMFLVPTILIAGSQLTRYIWTRRLLRQATRVT
jgi:hypothetical protein